MPPNTFIVMLLTLLGAASWAQVPDFVAGLHPDRRPDSAPHITQFDMTEAQRAQALRGIEGQPPANVVTVATTGAWWVPLRRPGMPPPYDLRGLHAGQAPAAAAMAGATAASR